MKCINAVVPVRTAVLDDINGLEESLVADIALEFAQQEALSMMLNNDSGSGTATPQTGSGYGLRGLNFYAGSTSAASFGTSGSATTNGRHTMLQVSQSYPTSITYDEMVALASALPAQYWNNPSTAWMMHPSTIVLLRDIKDSGGLPLFLEIGDKDGASVGNIFGHPVIPNPYMDEVGAGKFPVYLAAWDRFLTIADNEEIKFQRLEQTQPGFVNLYAEKRLCSTILDVFAGVRLYRGA
jgi:HK97 family phage major capsid protein